MGDQGKWGLESGPLCRIRVNGVSRVVRYAVSVSMGSREWSVMQYLCKWGLEGGPL